MTREEFFNSLNTGTKWDVGVAINRNNPLPLDASSVYESYEALLAYAQTSKTVYPGQICTVVATNEVAAYQITAVGDGATVVKLAASSASGDVAGDIVKLQTQVGNLETAVGKAAEGENAATGLHKAVADNAAAIDAVEAAVETLNGDVTVEGSVAKQVKDAVDAIDYSELYDEKGAAAQALVDAKAYADGKDEAIVAAKKAGDDAQAAVDAIEADYLKAADKTELEGKITANEDAIKLLTDGAGTAEIDSVKELIDYVNEHGTEVQGLKDDIAANTKAIEDHEALAAQTYETKTDAGTKLTEAKAYTDEEITKLGIGDYIKKVDADAAYDAIGAAAAVEELLTAHTGNADIHVTTDDKAKWNAAEQNAKDYAKGLDDATNVKVATLEGTAHTHGENNSLLEVLNGITADKVTAWDNAKTEAIAAAKTETENQIAALMPTINNKVEKVDNKDLIETTLIEKIETLDIATAEKAGLVLSTDAENGVAVAENGAMTVNSLNVNKLTQTSGEWLVLNGGASTLA